MLKGRGLRLLLTTARDEVFEMSCKALTSSSSNANAVDLPRHGSFKSLTRKLQMRKMYKCNRSKQRLLFTTSLVIPKVSREVSESQKH